MQCFMYDNFNLVILLLRVVLNSIMFRHILFFFNFLSDVFWYVYTTLILTELNHLLRFVTLLILLKCSSLTDHLSYDFSCSTREMGIIVTIA